MSASLRRVLDRAILRTVVVTSGTVIAIGLLVSFAAALKQDDDEAIAIAHDLAQELDEAGHATARSVFAKETSELALGARTVEAFDGSETLGGAARDSGSDGCTFEATERRCRVSIASFHVVVVTPLRSIASVAAPVGVAIFLTALLSGFLLFAAGRRSARGAVVPLLRLEAKLRDADALPRSTDVPETWGLAEEDSLSAALRAALARAEIATARETRCVADAAHELRTPLTRLRGQLELALQEPGLAGEPKDRIRLALANVTDLVRLTEALLAIARGALPQVEPVDLSDTVDAVLRGLDEQERARVEVSRTADALVSGEPALLEHALRNLVENALLHGEGTVTIATTLGDDVTVDVVDEGKGIVEAELERVKVAFVRGEGSGKSRGTGIGLALVDHVARLHGGSLTLENVGPPKSGFRARLRFPRWEAR